MKAREQLQLRLDQCPLIAILRGVTPGEVEAIGAELCDAGIGIIEIPLNSPSPYDSIARLAALLGDRALIGAGTVLAAGEVERVRAAGGRLIVSPNIDREVVSAAAEAEMVSVPGYFTPSEAFRAIGAGAHGLKYFPAEAASPAAIRAHKAVLPTDVPLLVVGGIGPGDMRPWIEAGASGFGLGSGLYRPGQSAEETAAKARAYIASLSG